MDIITSIQGAQKWRAQCVGKVGLVPTMGALHQGHLELMHQAKERCDHVIASVFVNPTQFGPGEDFDAYPRQLEEDAALCASVGVEAVFAPQADQMYPPGHQTVVHVHSMGDGLCGAHRPGHFDGVTTVVTKLLLLWRPDLAFFGQKDYQQLALIRQVVRDLYLPVLVCGVPTVREADGVAMSSRNRYLDPQDRLDARRLSQGLVRAWEAWQRGERRAIALTSKALEAFEGFDLSKVDYIHLVHPQTLVQSAGEQTMETAVMAMAVRVGRARLIDNLRLDEPLPLGLASLRGERSGD